MLLERGQALGAISATTTANTIAVVVMSLVLTPTLVILGSKLAKRSTNLPMAPWSSVSGQAPEVAADLESGRHVINAGYGTIGRILTAELEGLGVPVVIAELNAATVRNQTRSGRSITYGDVADPEVLESLNVREADALVLTIPDEEAVLRALQTARRMVPELYIAVRTSFPTMGQRATQLGANHVTVEEHASAHHLRQALLEQLLGEEAPLPNIEAESISVVEEESEGDSKSPEDHEQPTKTADPGAGSSEQGQVGTEDEEENTLAS